MNYKKQKIVNVPEQKLEIDPRTHQLLFKYIFSKFVLKVIQS